MSRRGASLKRRRPFRNPKPKITLVCEGKHTEPDYFYALARACGALVAVDLILERGAGVPMSVADTAIELLPRARGKMDTFSRYDLVWGVFDRNDHPRFEDAIHKAEAAGVSVAYSNPCFELWLILHFQDWNKPMHRHEMQRELRALMPSYDPNGSKRADFQTIANSVADAVRRAKTLEQNRILEGQPRGNPSTSVYQLVNAILQRGHA